MGVFSRINSLPCAPLPGSLRQPSPLDIPLVSTRRVSGLLAINIFLSGAAFAASIPFRAVVGIDTLGMSNATFGLIMALGSLGGAFASVFLGWLSDRMQDRRLLVFLCSLAGLAGFVMVYAIQTPLGFTLAFCLLVPFGGALFSQSFSYARAYYDRERPKHSQLIMSYLRSAFSLAWILVPPLAGWVAAKTSAYEVFAIAALAHLGCSLMVVGLMVTPDARVGLGPRSNDPTPRGRPELAPGYKAGIFGVFLSMIALQLNNTLLPLVILRDLDGTLAQVGIAAAVAAAIEVPVMIGWGYLALRWQKQTILAIACAAFAAYFLLISRAGSFAEVLALQGLAALAIGALISINISYLQEAIPGRVGLSTSLQDVTMVLAGLGTAAIFAANPWPTYAPLMVVAAILCLGGAVALLLARPSVAPA